MAEGTDFTRIANVLAYQVKGGDCLTLRQLAILGQICSAREVHRVRHLAETLGVSKPVVTRAIKRLSAAGLVIQRRDPVDRRDVIILPTDEGKTANRMATDGITAIAHDGMPF